MKFLASVIASMLFAGISYAKTCEVSVDANDAMAFSTKTISAAGCSELKVTLKHTGKLPKAAMGHNLVIAAEGDVAAVTEAATKAGPAKDYSPGTAKVIAATKLLAGGETDSFTVASSKFKKGTKYKFFCTFPGHGFIMIGDVSL